MKTTVFNMLDNNNFVSLSTSCVNDNRLENLLIPSALALFSITNAI